MVTLDTPVTIYLDLIRERIALLTGDPFITDDQCHGVVWGRSQGDITMAECVQRMRQDPEYTIGLKMAQVQTCRDLVSEDIADAYVDMILDEPLVCAIVYRSAKRDEVEFGQPPLTEAQRRKLLSAFHSAYQPDGLSKTPIAEAEIEADVLNGLAYPILPPLTED